MTPQRIQRRRRKGWRMPEGAVYVGRPSLWGNPYRVVPMPNGEGWRVIGRGEALWSADETQWTKAQAAEVAIDKFRDTYHPNSYRTYEMVHALRGRDLACWCPLSQPCHADVLLEMANGDRP